MKPIILILIYIAIIGNFSIASAQWYPTNGPGGGPVYDIKQIGNRLFAAAGDVNTTNFYAGGVFTSDNMGETWVLRHHGMENCRVYCLLSFSNKIYAGTSSGIFISSDNGNTWLVSNNGLINKKVKALAVKDNILFAGNDGAGLHKSTDGGLTWMNLFNFQSVNKIFVDGNNLFVMGPSDGAYRKSSDNGNTWTAYGTANGILTTSSTGMARLGNDLYLTTYDLGLYKSSNGGENWTALQNGSSGATFLQNLGDTLWTSVALNGSIWKFYQGSTSWQALPYTIEAPGVTAMVGTGNHLFFSTSKGIFRKTVTESPKILGNISNGKIRWMSFNQGRLFATTETGVFISDDMGQSWIRTFYNATDGVKPILKWQGVMLTSSMNSGIFKSKDNGNTWVQTGFSLPVGEKSGMAQAGKVILATVRSNGLYKSLDTGNTWTKITAYPATSPANLRKVNAATGSSFLLFSATSNKTYWSADTGNTWNLCIFNHPSSGPSSSVLHGVIRQGSVLYANSTYHLYKSEDEGANWNYIEFPAILPSVTTNVPLFSDSNGIEIPVSNSRIIRSSDGGSNWEIDTLMLSSINNSTFYAMSGQAAFTGLWEYGGKKFLGTDGLGVWSDGFVPNANEELLHSDAKSKMMHIYPNPGRDKIHFQFPGSNLKNAQLRLMDALGKVIFYIGSAEALKDASLYWNTAHLPRGLYHYHLNAEGISESGSVVLE